MMWLAVFQVRRSGGRVGLQSKGVVDGERQIVVGGFLI